MSTPSSTHPIPHSHPQTKRIAFLGATGGCTLAALSHTLLACSSTSSTSSSPPSPARYHCIALARQPAKLTALLLNQPDITASVLDAHLTIIQGDALDRTAIRRLLTSDSDGDEVSVETIIQGVGARPSFQWSVRAPVTIDQPTLCADVARVVVESLQDLQKENRKNGKIGEEKKEKKPLLAFVSSTGISRGKEDVGFWFRWLYHVVLKGAHQDKRGMEDCYRAAVAGFRDEEQREKGGRGEEGEGGKEGVLRGVVGVRPSLLMGTGDLREEKPVEQVRVGREAEPAVGYLIRRADVGAWIFREVVEKDGDGWVNEMASLTY